MPRFPRAVPDDMCPRSECSAHGVEDLVAFGMIPNALLPIARGGRLKRLRSPSMFCPPEAHTKPLSKSSSPAMLAPFRFRERLVRARGAARPFEPRQRHGIEGLQRSALDFHAGGERFAHRRACHVLGDR